MIMMIWITALAIQGSNATTRPATTQNPAPVAKKDIQAAARDFSEQIRNNVQQQINAARIDRAAALAAQGEAAEDQGEPVVAPTPPVPPGRVFTIQGPDGNTQITIPPRAFENTIPPQAVDISIAFFLMIAAIVIGLPLARAFARRMDRRGAGTPQIPAEITSQLAHLNQSVDAIALEIERISEGQRFTTRLLSEHKEALPTGVNR
jgi:hypothetical protein